MYGFSQELWLIKLNFDFHKQERNKFLLSILILLFFHLKLSLKMLKIVDCWFMLYSCGVNRAKENDSEKRFQILQLKLGDIHMDNSR